jgi:hypothetical protein
MLIFLDIDGVMVPAKSWKSPELLNDGFAAFSSKATHVLEHLVSGSNTIILTTSHKSNFNIEEWKNIFRNRGLNVENLKCLPANINNLTRKEEIVSYFNINSIHEDFIIIDDDKSLNGLPDFLKKYFVETSPYIGLTEKHLEIINKISRSNLLSA